MEPTDEGVRPAGTFGDLDAAVAATVEVEPGHTGPIPAQEKWGVGDLERPPGAGDGDVGTQAHEHGRPPEDRVPLALLQLGRGVDLGGLVHDGRSQVGLPPIEKPEHPLGQTEGQRRVHDPPTTICTPPPPIGSVTSLIHGSR